MPSAKRFSKSTLAVAASAAAMAITLTPAAQASTSYRTPVTSTTKTTVRVPTHRHVVGDNDDTGLTGGRPIICIYC